MPPEIPHHTAGKPQEYPEDISAAIEELFRRRLPVKKNFEAQMPSDTVEALPTEPDNSVVRRAILLQRNLAKTVILKVFIENKIVEFKIKASDEFCSLLTKIQKLRDKTRAESRRIQKMQE